MGEKIRFYTWKDYLRCFFKGHDWDYFTSSIVNYSSVTGRTCRRCGRNQEVKITYKNKK